MPYTTVRNELILTFIDEREDQRNKVLELGGLVVVTDDDAARFDNVSKSGVIKYRSANVQVDLARTGAAGSEVKDTMRLFFRMADATHYHLDVPDPKDTLFLAADGPGANIVKDYSVLAAAAPGTPEKDLADIIDLVLAGSILISDGETPESYLHGERI